MSKKTVVTFSCSKSVHVYYESSSVRPMLPCCFHESVHKAKAYLKERRGIKKPDVIVNK